METHLRWVLTQLDEPPAPRKVARRMFNFRRRPTSVPIVVPARPAPAALTPAREPADRTAHPDDQHLVFWNSETSQASAAHLSEAAATWHQAVSKQPAVPKAE